MWRAAFEDLLSAELGKEQEAHPAWTNRVNNQKLYASWAQTPVDWMLGLQCRGVLPPQLPAIYQFQKTKHIDEVFSDILNGRSSPRTMHSWHGAQAMADFERLAMEISHFDEDERADQMSRTPDTEQDLYEAFLGKASPETQRQETTKPPSSSRTTSTAVNKPDVVASKILSTLSTTERTTLSDGSVTTKVTLKKRFSDGREESTETLSTNHAAMDSTSPTPVSAVSNASSGRDQQDQKKGWFWS